MHVQDPMQKHMRRRPVRLTWCMRGNAQCGMVRCRDRWMAQAGSAAAVLLAALST